MKCKSCGHEITEPTKTLIVTINKQKWEVEKEIHHKGNTYAECEKDCPKGWEIPTYYLIQELRNSKYCEELGLLYTWEFVQNLDKIEREKGNVARFSVGSGWADLCCYGNPANSYSSLGVRFVRRIKE